MTIDSLDPADDDRADTVPTPDPMPTESDDLEATQDSAAHPS